MMRFSLVVMIGLEKCCITSACLQWLCHSGERTVARGPLVFIFNRLFSNPNTTEMYREYVPCTRNSSYSFIKLGMHIDIVEIWFGIASG